MANLNEKKLLTTRDVALVLDMSPDTIAEFARKSMLHGLKKGREWKFKKSDVIRFAKYIGSSAM